MEMKHTGDYELDEINMLEQECADLEEENRKLKKDLEFVYGWKDQLEKENKRLKAQIEKMSWIWLVSAAPTVILDD